MLLPFDRQKLKARNARDLEDQVAAAVARSAAQGMIEVADLADVVRRLESATAEGAPGASTIAEKARLYVRPLLAARRA